MPCFTILYTVFLSTILVSLYVSRAAAADISAFKTGLEKRYSTAHSLGDNYQFNSGDGWQAINVTNLQYKYSRSTSDLSVMATHLDGPHHHRKRSSKSSGPKKSSKSSKQSSPKKSDIKMYSTSANSTAKSITKGLLGSVKGSIKDIVSTIKGVGSPEPVTITWYTGHDLLNPSCWSNPSWAPTDNSFACALTLNGWTDKPKCFQFLELCNTSKKCVFVRVVDSCAGCAGGSKHVDLTKAAFSELADLDEGILTVQMRPATSPDGWLENLWGPKA
ncbi:uncharacterized protein FIBRA_07008 [Fibroporia radiculosa]|uniref:RlpA-like protein double-psi beta-barrel domain-containing protein n=1 Tax=Fibroporia radiculosa TaxID=599839 RepID=J4GU47_9APHY|nr:uncharacterized protein FIBRA_07008 [Fibroporia radiculosa]CCM04815.1 predicted protein [Fibroporia radiculosa]